MTRSKVVTQLPPHLRAQLDQKLIGSSFSDYSGLATWLTEQGYTISRSALQRYGSQFEQRVQAIALATDQARAITQATPDSEAAMSETLLRLIQERMFGLLVRANVSERDLPRLARAIADLGRTAVTHRRYIEQLRERLEQQKKIAVEQLPKGLSRQAAQHIRSILLGIDPFRGQRPPTVRSSVLGGDGDLLLAAPAESAAAPDEDRADIQSDVTLAKDVDS